MFPEILDHFLCRRLIPCRINVAVFVQLEHERPRQNAEIADADLRHQPEHVFVFRVLEESGRQRRMPGKYDISDFKRHRNVKHSASIFPVMETAVDRFPFCRFA